LAVGIEAAVMLRAAAAARGGVDVLVALVVRVVVRVTDVDVIVRVTDEDVVVSDTVVDVAVRVMEVLVVTVDERVVEVVEDRVLEVVEDSVLEVVDDTVLDVDVDVTSRMNSVCSCLSQVWLPHFRCHVASTGGTLESSELQRA